ncbi:MAG TPA: adenylate/guanylate cyclase domain-containing protein [Chitinophagaceae bacterium]|nr:adenylate/guanylate cyclase domain-containing protein [Chitinophagaceae bacterium]HRG92199.1 adenylate/guanylate cyclase domain-containing protein [Chitinophagaceae bacterium]
MAGQSHQLAAILFADIVGYTAMMQENEELAVEKVNRFREVVELVAEELNGKIVQYYGDGSLLLFQSSTDAAEFAKLLQEDLYNEPQVPVRIGIHMGDVLVHAGNIFGDVVNIASRIQSLAPAGGVYISEVVYRNIANKKELESVFVKEEKLKNVKDPMRIYQLLTEGIPAPVHMPETPGIPVASANANHIAVLPFANLSSDPQQDYFSDGLTEDIITQLSKIRAYKVISRTSVMQYKTSPKSVKDIGKELGVSLILEGSVQRHGEKVRITAQLINAITDEHIWADSYDRSLHDIFTIQREVALAIAAVLNTTLTKKETQELDYIPTADVQAYDLYMRGRLMLEKRSKADVLSAREYFQQAVARDKGFAAAYAGLADSFLLSSFRGYEDPVQMLWQAKKHIDVAAGLDPYSGETQASLGYWYFQNFDWHAAEITYQRAIRLNANQTNVYLWLAILLQAKGDNEGALQVYDQGIEINPVWDFLLKNKVILMANMNNMEAAVALQEERISKAHEPEQKEKLYTELSKLHFSAGNQDEAIQAAEKANDKGLLQFYANGDISLMKQPLDIYYEGMEQRSEYISQLWMGLQYAHAGARDRAIECFNNAVALKEAAISLLLIRDFEFLNIKYLNMALLTRKVKQLINF